MIGEQTAVLEVFAGVGSRIENRAELVELFQSVPAGPRKPPQNSQIQPGWISTVDADDLGHDLNAFDRNRSFALPLPLVEEDEFERVEVGGEDQHMVGIALAQGADQIIANLGRERLRLGEDDPQELLGIFRQQLDSLELVRRLAGQADSLWRQDRPRIRLISEICQEAGQRVGRRKLRDLPGGKIEIGRMLLHVVLALVVITSVLPPEIFPVHPCGMCGGSIGVASPSFCQNRRLESTDVTLDLWLSPP